MRQYLTELKGESVDRKGRQFTGSMKKNSSTQERLNTFRILSRSEKYGDRSEYRKQIINDTNSPRDAKIR